MKAPSLSRQAALLILLCMASACTGSGTSTTHASVQVDSPTPTLAAASPEATSAPSATQPPVTTDTPSPTPTATASDTASPTPTATSTTRPEPSLLLDCTTRNGFDLAERARALYFSAIQSGQTDAGTLRELARKCATFTLDFTSTVVGNSASISGAQLTARVNAQVLIAMDDKGEYAGAGPIHYDHFDIDPPNPNTRDCQPYRFSPADSTLLVTGLDLGTAGDAGQGLPPPSLITLLMDPGSLLENVSLTCKGVTVSFLNTPTGFWESAFRIFHAGEQVGNQAEIIGWVFSGDAAIVATREYHQAVTHGKVKLREDTIMTLTHTPQP
jgi:hypothetical protein